MSILTYVEPWKVCLVKHAGFTEPDEKPEKMRLENAVKAAEALVYTLPYPQLMDASNTKLLKEIIRQDECELSSVMHHIYSFNQTLSIVYNRVFSVVISILPDHSF